MGGHPNRRQSNLFCGTQSCKQSGAMWCLWVQFRALFNTLSGSHESNTFESSWVVQWQCKNECLGTLSCPVRPYLDTDQKPKTGVLRLAMVRPLSPIPGHIPPNSSERTPPAFGEVSARDARPPFFRDVVLRTWLIIHHHRHGSLPLNLPSLPHGPGGIGPAGASPKPTTWEAGRTEQVHVGCPKPWSGDLADSRKSVHLDGSTAVCLPVPWVIYSRHSHVSP